MEARDLANAVAFWRSIEIFTPQRIDKTDPRKRIADFRSGDRLPWQPGYAKPLLDTPKKKWRHDIYLCVFPINRLFKAVADVLPVEQPEKLRKERGHTALASFQLDEHGHAIRGSEVLSSCGWAMARTRNPGPTASGWLAGFDQAQAGFSAVFADLVEMPDDSPEETNERVSELSLDDELLDECLRAVLSVTGLDRFAGRGGSLPELNAPVFRIRSYQISDGYKKTPSSNFLNSFILDDLARVASYLSETSPSGALAAYLERKEQIEGADRIDVRRQLDATRALTAPGRIPLGRWPAQSDELLALGQQLAVNDAFSMVDSDGVTAVNGPPGTGKTTLLRDLVAGLVTERARRLVLLRDPRDAFDGKIEWNDETKHTVYPLKREFAGFEIVVASSNNGAVENVTFEMPRREQIGSDWMEAAAMIDYFPDLAREALAAQSEARAVADPEDQADGGGLPNTVEASVEAWALIAARLGSRKNCRAFFKPVLFGERTDKTGKTVRLEVPGLNDRLGAGGNARAATDWEAARQRFNEALATVERFQQQRLEADRALEKIDELGRQRARLRAAVQTLVERTERDRPELETAAAGEQQTAARYDQARVALDHHAQAKPSWFRSRARGRWASEHAEMSLGVALLAEQAAAARDLHRRHIAIVKELQAARTCLEALEAQLSRERDALPSQCVIPDREWEIGAAAIREPKAPWLDVGWNQARTRLFLEALNLHRAFVYGASTQIRRNMGTVEAITRGRHPEQLATAAAAAWQSLFLVTPVVSTTFASAGRLFRHLGEGALGWVLIDEAGQATPQNPVGMLWRSRRAVVVGDPIQLRPVHSIPVGVERALLENASVSEQWLTTTTSVQERADERSRRGTTIVTAGERLWVGLPLLVHRRCDQPMFEIVNEIAYGGLMHHATGDRRAAEFVEKWPQLPASGWYHVPASTSAGHWRHEEGALLQSLLDELFRTGFAPGDVMAISPFKDVGTELAALGLQKSHDGLTAGTVHTSQGKEADVVFIVLGSDTSGSGGDRDWATEAPNLINVAVSRAKRRLYVIGDRSEWQDHRYFTKLTQSLPVIEPVEARV